MNPWLMLSMWLAGMGCGIMMNLALGYKPHHREGLLGGLLVGILMWILSGGIGF